MKTVMLVFGTRPEAVKMCPLVRELRTRKDIRTLVCVTGQHRELLRGVLAVFGVTPDYDLSVMKEGQTLSAVTESILSRITPILKETRPDTVLVHGDTTTAFAAALACFYLQIPVGHVEAGLRTYDIYSPFPEEFNRRAISLLAVRHFAPTAQARENLLREGCPPERICITGNTGIDALRYTLRADYTHPALGWAKGRRLVLITAHRRENLGAPMREMFRAIRGVLAESPDAAAVCPLHKNPAVRAVAEAEFGGFDRVLLTEPLELPDFHNFLARAYLVLTDSGGVQEEAAALGKPTLVMREETERPEGVAAGTLMLVGRSEAGIASAFRRLLREEKIHAAMSGAKNPYGDGYASRRIADALADGEKWG